MTGFCGQDRCLIDANGRLKLPPRVEQAFRRAGALEIVFHCLPEGALAVYPIAFWEQLRAEEAKDALRTAASIVIRRQLRRFGALTQVETLSNQGRITIPAGFRSLVALEPGTEAVVVGCEVGVEIWNSGRWQEELGLVRDHETLRADAEMKADVAAAGIPPATRNP